MAFVKFIKNHSEGSLNFKQGQIIECKKQLHDKLVSQGVAVSSSHKEKYDNVRNMQKDAIHKESTNTEE